MLKYHDGHDFPNNLSRKIQKRNILQFLEAQQNEDRARRILAIFSSQNYEEKIAVVCA